MKEHSGELATDQLLPGVIRCAHAADCIHLNQRFFLLQLA